MKARTSIIQTRHSHNSFGSLLMIGIVLLFIGIPVNAQTGGAAHYRYDANGRLTAVLSPTGEAVTYSYDPAGNFTSITRYAANQLSILDFTPGSGSVGTQVTIYGTGFSTTPSSNTVKFNNVNASVTAATNIQLTVTVPAGATTGTISVTNANGSINSSNQFFISAESLYFTGQINFGETKTLPNSQPNQSALLTFNGVSGQRVSLLADQVSPFSGAGAMSLVSPSGVTLATAPIQSQGGAGVTFGFMEPQTLSASGAYSIIINPTDTSPVTMNITLYDVPADIIGNIPSNGSAYPLSFTPGQNARPTFSGVVGQKVSLLASQAVTTIFLTDLAIIKPDGSNLITDSLGNPESVFIEPVILPVNGVYTILVDPKFNKTRETILNLYDVPPDVSGTLTVQAPTPPPTLSPVTIPTPGQAANLTFSVSGSQQVTIHIRNLAIGGFNAPSTLTLSTQGGTQIHTQTINSNADYDIQKTLPAAGTYVIKIDPQKAATGSLNIYLTTP